MLATTPPGLRDAMGRSLGLSTVQIVDRFSRSRWSAGAIAWLWQRAGCDAEALALLTKAGAGFSALRLRCLFAMELYRSFLDALSGRPTPDRLVPARGIALFATGDTDRALPDLAAAFGKRSHWGLWLRVAFALYVADPDYVRRMLQSRRREPVAALLTAHLFERAGATGEAGETLDRCALHGRRAAEGDLLRANIALRQGDTKAGGLAIEQVFGHYGLPAPDRAAPSRYDSGPRVSIIVAAHNAEGTIDAALLSLTGQSWRNLEIIVVDDASTDGTLAKVRAQVAADSRVRIIPLASNAGAYAARNTAIAEARGAFVAFHDADDIAHPERIARQIGPLLKDGTQVFSLARWVRRVFGGPFRCRQIAPLIRLHVGSMLVRREFLAVLGGFDAVRFGGDNDLLLRLKVAAGVHRFTVLDLPLTVGGYDSRSAVHDSATGYGAKGYCVERQSYLEKRSWRLIQELVTGSDDAAQDYAQGTKIKFNPDL